MTGAEIDGQAGLGTDAPIKRLPFKAWAWSIFEAGRLPYIFLITGYVFMPYFVTEVIGDPVKGQALVASATKTAGIVMALSAPLLGAVVDQLGPRKPALAALTAVLLVVLTTLWWVTPGSPVLPVGAVLTLVVIASLALGYSEVLHNSMLVGVAGLKNASAASSLGLTLGNVTAVSTLAFLLWGVSLPGTVDSPWIPKAPLFGVDHATFEHARIAGPIAAMLIGVAALPLLLFVPDLKRSQTRVSVAVRRAVLHVVDLPKVLKGNRDAAVFLIGRLFYADAVAAIIMFTGLYSAGVMGWRSTELLVLAICRTSFAVFGSLAAARLDAWIGCRRALIAAVSFACLCLFGMLSCTRDTVLFVIHFDAPAAVWTSPIFSTLPELVFVGFAAMVTSSVACSAASARSLLTRLTPPEQTGAYFGLFALAGTATAWLAPLLVEVFTRSFASQRAGFAPLLVLMVLGLLAFTAVRGGNQRAADLT